MEIEHILNETKGFFRALDLSLEAGRLTYSRAGEDLIILDHTEVSEAYAGKGVGKKLVMAAVEHARKNEIKILPLCPFAKKLFEKTPEIGDVLR